jgi:hypothetical protein
VGRKYRKRRDTRGARGPAAFSNWLSSCGAAPSATQWVRSQSKQHIDENMLFATYEKQQQIVAAAVTTTKATRRRAEAARRGKVEKPPVASSIDFTQEAASLPMEI